ncbi:PIN domain-containing protein [Mycetocola saprophilus]|uniref:PIN domain-containing protein n=1 Tax=Mycetocola saprophilus TaxID=76636 RepID=UPI003BF11F16
MFTALLDTNILWPSLQRDFFLSLAIEGSFRPVWSEAILDELEESERRKLIERRHLTPIRAQLSAMRLTDRMRHVFPEALVHGWEPLDGTFGLPDRDDEHVVAAAQVAGAGFIVTDNLKDFPVALLPVSITPVSARKFAFDIVSDSPLRALSALEEISQRSGLFGPETTSEQIIGHLESRYGFTDTAELLRLAAFEND